LPVLTGIRFPHIVQFYLGHKFEDVVHPIEKAAFADSPSRWSVLRDEKVISTVFLMLTVQPPLPCFRASKPRPAV
jgi:hypothetical protein